MLTGIRSAGLPALPRRQPARRALEWLEVGPSPTQPIFLPFPSYCLHCCSPHPLTLSLAPFSPCFLSFGFLLLPTWIHTRFLAIYASIISQKYFVKSCALGSITHCMSRWRLLEENDKLRTPHCHLGISATLGSARVFVMYRRLYRRHAQACTPTLYSLYLLSFS